MLTFFLPFVQKVDAPENFYPIHAYCNGVLWHVCEGEGVMLFSTFTIKDQATIPAKVRNKLDLRPSDKVVFETGPFDYAYHAALSDTLDEWNSSADDQNYASIGTSTGCRL